MISIHSKFQMNVMQNGADPLLHMNRITFWDLIKAAGRVSNLCNDKMRFYFDTWSRHHRLFNLKHSRNVPKRMSHVAEPFASTPAFSHLCSSWKSQVNNKILSLFICFVVVAVFGKTHTWSMCCFARLKLFWLSDSIPQWRHKSMKQSRKLEKSPPPSVLLLLVTQVHTRWGKCCCFDVSLCSAGGKFPDAMTNSLSISCTHIVHILSLLYFPEIIFQWWMFTEEFHVSHNNRL